MGILSKSFFSKIDHTESDLDQPELYKVHQGNGFLYTWVGLTYSSPTAQKLKEYAKYHPYYPYYKALLTKADPSLHIEVLKEFEEVIWDVLDLFIKDERYGADKLEEWGVTFVPTCKGTIYGIKDGRKFLIRRKWEPETKFQDKLTDMEFFEDGNT